MLKGKCVIQDINNNNIYIHTHTNKKLFEELHFYFFKVRQNHRCDLLLEYPWDFLCQCFVCKRCNNTHFTFVDAISILIFINKITI